MSAILELETRNTGGLKPRQLRRLGRIPGVIYGVDHDPVTVHLPVRALEAAIRRGEAHRPVTVRLEPGGKAQLALLKAIQRDMFSQEPIHVDLLAVRSDTVVPADVPVVVTGEDSLIRRRLVLQVQMRSVPVQALPANLPDAFEIAVGDLAEGATVTVADLKVPEGVTVTADAGQVVLTLNQPRVHEEPADTGTPADGQTSL